MSRVQASLIQATAAYHLTLIWEEYTICTAIAPEAVFTVRMQATDETTGPG